MSMANALQVWRKRAQQIAKSPKSKVFFFDVDGVLLDAHTGRYIEQNRLLFTLSELWRAGHLLAIATNVSIHDTQKVHQIEALIQNIGRKTGVPVLLCKHCSFSNPQQQHLLHAAMFEQRNHHPNRLGKNTQIMLSLAKLGLYCRPRAHQNALLVSPSARLPNESMVLQHNRSGILSQQVVLVDADAHDTAAAEAIGYRVLLTHKALAHDEGLSQQAHHLHHLLHTYTSIREKSLAWLNHTDLEKAHNENEAVSHWVRYLYYLQHFYPHNTSIPAQTLKQRLVRRCVIPKKKRSRKEVRLALYLILVAGVVVACIGMGLRLGGIGSAISMATAGMGLKVIIAKMGLYFGIGSASGMSAVMLKKSKRWAKREYEKKRFAKWMRSQQMIAHAISCQQHAFNARVEQQRAKRGKSYSMVDQIAHVLSHRYDPSSRVQIRAVDYHQHNSAAGNGHAF